VRTELAHSAIPPFRHYPVTSEPAISCALLALCNRGPIKRFFLYFFCSFFFSDILNSSADSSDGKKPAVRANHSLWIAKLGAFFILSPPGQCYADLCVLNGYFIIYITFAFALGELSVSVFVQPPLEDWVIGNPFLPYTHSDTGKA